MKKKVVVLVLAAMMVLGCAMGATLAWLTDSATVTNTFTPSNINITLTETNPALDTDVDSPNKGNHVAKMVPGATITKDPVVTVVKYSEKCFLFVEIDDSAVKDYLDYNVATGWTQLTGLPTDTKDSDYTANKVYYRVVDYSTSDQPFGILTDNKVTVKNTLGKTEMAAVGTGVDMVFTAYAVQYENIATADDNDNALLAWAQRVK